MSNEHYDFCIVGGGIAGLTLARELAERGLSVVVIERRCIGAMGDAAAYAAAGMLAPLVEARLEEREILEFGSLALAFYPGFIDNLTASSGIDVGYLKEGTLIVATDRDDLEQIRHSYNEHLELGLPVEWLSGYECRDIEPMLGPSVPAGILSRRDHQVDNRSLLQALVTNRRFELREWVKRTELEGAPSRENKTGHRVVAVHADGERITAGRYIVATGARTDIFRTLLPEVAAAIRPVKGQIIRLDQRAFRVLGHVVRTPDVYLVPKFDGSLVVGASSEDHGFDTSVTAGEIHELLESAIRVVPSVRELPISETRVGFRPATQDHLPLLGPTGVEDLWIADGYYRHGILFSPFAARLLADALTGENISDWLETFSPKRFHETSTERS